VAVPARDHTHDREEAYMPSLAAAKIDPAPITAQPVRTTVFLTPDRVSKMLQERRNFQIVKFRTNCSDCVPNL
jgi:hypothetical protein